MSRNKRSSSTGFIYRIVCTATHIQTGKKLEERFGAHRTYQDAERWKNEQEEAVGEPGYEYDYRIEPVLPEDFMKER